MTEERDMEIEALGAIYMDSFNLIDQESIQITLLPNPGQDEPNYVGVILDIKFTPDYPNEVPIIKLTPQLNLTNEQLEEIKELVTTQANENIGTSMIFILTSVIKEWLDNNNQEPKGEESEEEEEESEESEEEEAVFEGTPCTEETFNAWRKKFNEEFRPVKKEIKSTKLTGRQLFEYDATLSISDSKLMEEGEETSNISAASIKPKIEEVAQQVDWSLFADDDIPEDFDEDEE